MAFTGKILSVFSAPTVKIVLKGLSQDPPTAGTFLREDFPWGEKKLSDLSLLPRGKAPGF